MSKVEEIKKQQPSRLTDGRYAVLQETNGEEFESWLYFIRIQGNDEKLKHLADQLKEVDFYILEDLSTFDLELERNVSALTAKEMSKLELNHCGFHRKFDGILKKIDFDFKKKDGNDTKICKVFDVLGMGQIEDYIDDEDIDEEDMVSDGDDSGSESGSGSGSESESGSGDGEENRKKLSEKINEKKQARMPTALKNMKR